MIFDFGRLPRHQRIEDQIRAQLRRNPQLNVTRTGNDLRWQAPPLRQPQRPPGFSKLPEPKRPEMPPPYPAYTRDRRSMPPQAVPTHAPNYSAIPVKLRPLYETGPSGWTRTAPGALLGHYRDQKRADPLAEPIAKRGTLTKAQWATLVAVSEPGQERQHFMRSVATRHILVEG